ncbi:MAG: hypothetical protein OEM02_15305 [Desulfobulbaceae bacterium]|nr:hypothetical protein [Desulfobulbaceae bacterium]
MFAYYYYVVISRGTGTTTAPNGGQGFEPTADNRTDIKNESFNQLPFETTLTTCKNKQHFKQLPYALFTYSDLKEKWSKI